MGMYDNINGRLLCPVCGEMTQMNGQTKFFDGVLGNYDLNNLPFEKLFEYSPERKKDSISYHYDVYRKPDDVKSKAKAWHLEITSIMECSVCHSMMDYNIICVSDTHKKRKHTTDWVPIHAYVDGVWADTLPAMQKKYGKHLNLDVNYLTGKKRRESVCPLYGKR